MDPRPTTYGTHLCTHHPLQGGRAWARWLQLCGSVSAQVYGESRIDIDISVCVYTHAHAHAHALISNKWFILQALVHRPKSARRRRWRILGQYVHPNRAQTASGLFGRETAQIGTSAVPSAIFRVRMETAGVLLREKGALPDCPPPRFQAYLAM